MQSKILILILLWCYLVTVQAKSLLGSSLNTIKTMELNQSHQLKVKIEPHQQLILQFITQNITDRIELDISSTASYQICTLDTQKECFKNYVRHSKKQNCFSFSRQQIINGIKIKNPSITKKIKVVINYHIENQQCHKLQTRVLHRKQLKHSSCFLFQLNKQQDVQLIIIKQQFLELKYQLQVCSNDYKVTHQNLSNNKFKINFLEIIKLCIKQSNMTLKINITHRVQNTSQHKNTPLIGLLLQYLQQSLLLPDGIAYVTSFTDHLNAEVFEYQLLNRENTTINVISDLSLEIYAKVVEQTLKDQTIPNKHNCDFSSKTGFIFTYFRPYLLITKDVLQKYKCKDCYLVVSVWTSDNLVQMNKKNKFSIQITQHSSTLMNGQMKHQFLQTGAFAYYTFNTQIDTLTVYELADNNKNCAIFYLSDEEVPGPENYLKKSQKNKIMHKSDSNTPIFIGIKAESDCAYSISATKASTQFTKLQKSRFANLNLLKDEIKYFIIETTICEYIKLLSLHIYGSVDIYLNKTDITAIKQLKKDKIDYTQFKKKGQYMNRLVLSSKDEIFCEGCYYIIAVVAKKLTQSTLFYGDQNTLIPIHDKTINDIIPNKDTKIKGEYFGQSKFELQVKIHSGKLRLSINKGEQKFTQIYQALNVMKKQVVDLGSNSFLFLTASVLNLQTLEVSFEALEDNTIYSVKFNSITEGILSSLSKLFKQEKLEDQNCPLAKIQNYSLQPGHDLYLHISDQQTISVSGYFRDSGQKILLSSNIDDSQLFSQLNLTLWINAKNIQYKLQRMRNILTLQIPKLKNYAIKQGIKYNLSINLNSSGILWITIMQAEDFQLLSPHIYSHFHNSFTFVTHTQSDLIVELLQCKGKANLVYGSERQQLDKNQNTNLDMIGLANQPHALRISRLSTTFYKVTAQQAILRWFPFKLQDGIGTGYIDYKAGNLNYESTMISVKFNWLSLSRANVKNKTKAKVVENISYVIYIATSQNTLSQYSQCQPFIITEKQQGLKIANIVEYSQSLKLNQTLSFTLSKRQLLNKFGQNITLYATIVAELILSSNSTTSILQKERYRFIYDQIQIPHNLLLSSYIVESNYDQLISAVLLVAAAIVISTYLFINKLMPVFGILKNRYFVQENQQIGLPVQNAVPSENDNQYVPQSSDRRGIASTGQRIELDQQS